MWMLSPGSKPECRELPCARIHVVAVLIKHFPVHINCRPAGYLCFNSLFDCRSCPCLFDLIKNLLSCVARAVWPYCFVVFCQLTSSKKLISIFHGNKDQRCESLSWHTEVTHHIGPMPMLYNNVATVSKRARVNFSLFFFLWVGGRKWTELEQMIY